MKMTTKRKKASGMRGIIGLLVFIATIILAVYVGGWVMFIGGIIQCVNAFNLSPTDAMTVAISIVKILCSGLVGWLIFLVGMFISSLFTN